METQVAVCAVVATFIAFRCATRRCAAFEAYTASAAAVATSFASRYAGSVVTASASAGATCLGGFDQLSVRSRAWLFWGL